MNLAEIKTAIASLSEKERNELNVWLQILQTDEWERQIEQEARAGKFDARLREAEASRIS